MLLQGERMNAVIGNGDNVIPAAGMNFIKMLVIALLIPLLDRVVYPLIHRFRYQKPTLLQRIGGFYPLLMLTFLVIIAMLYWKRLISSRTFHNCPVCHHAIYLFAFQCIDHNTVFNNSLFIWYIISKHVYTMIAWFVNRVLWFFLYSIPIHYPCHTW